ncbi:hypothetical protein WJX84_006891 [Apatococcus fuscideae]|uniref:Uncharacterized protein n=1 Tax=Apatococcus fuscideae TaxID=2026836 RepID=A0AAW1SKJ2_9CHLO
MPLQGFKRYQELMGALPDAVALSSAFWDLARWTQHMPEITAADNLNNELLVEFGEHLSHVMMQIEGQAPAALWIFRTTAPPELKNCSDGSGVHANNLLGKHSHVVALNTISRDIARRRGWEAPASSYEEKTV